MTQLVFATHNRHKLSEVSAILGPGFRLLSLADIGCEEEIPETAATLEGNALLKARFVKDNYGYDCFADDTGLEVASLGNAPGVYSARYAGEACKPEANMLKLLAEMHDAANRKARFRTVVALVDSSGERCFEGIINGRIISERRGTSGFGYDPVFVPDGYRLTFAEMEPEAKNRISHRAEAIRRLAAYLQTIPRQ
ncbi:MAG: non-canonical purine NTP diphosphatase [Tannerellaceae bacterium]|jgi:XTP/dITP diphosphohydrolase|nr:non-canonical purine NTP diphosphatase [Tannerellaceae bacterium]